MTTRKDLLAWIAEHEQCSANAYETLGDRIGRVRHWPELRFQISQYLLGVELAAKLADRDRDYEVFKQWASELVGNDADEYVEGGYEILVQHAVERLRL